jgi:hypothetical protein
MSTNWKDGIPDDFGFSRYGESPYYNPPKDYALLNSAELRGESYEFCLVAVWKRTSDGKLFGAADSGCSCPTPFGDLTPEGMKPIESTDDLLPLAATILYEEPAKAKKTLTNHVEWAELLAKVHRALREVKT